MQKNMGMVYTVYYDMHVYFLFCCCFYTYFLLMDTCTLLSQTKYQNRLPLFWGCCSASTPVNLTVYNFNPSTPCSSSSTAKQN